MIAGLRILSWLGATASTRLGRALRSADQALVLLRLLDPVTPVQATRFRREFELLQALDVPGVPRPLAFCSAPPHLGMVLQDFNGQPLEAILNLRPLDLTLCLRLAGQLARTLAGVHAAGVVHQDIRPANLLVAPEEGKVCLVDFSFATRQDRAKVAPAGVSGLEGDPVYLSPEQTGRMNRAVDYRTDLYSLGITLYRMLTGHLPFHADDPLEWVHCHIARIPRAPADVIAGIPRPVSDIVMKLLAKEAEDRYQSAHGLRHDLDRCLAQVEDTGRITPFVLGTRDMSDRFRIPQRLYGREVEVATLLSAFDRTADSGRPELLLVAGYSGIGKSSLVQELHKPIVREHGYFISGKFDQYKRDIPYATFVQAFRVLLLQILTEKKEQIEAWRQRLSDAIGINAQVVVDVIPELELILGKQPPVQELSATEAQNRFHLVFRQFLGVFAQREHPLALFLDDLQWLDSGSLKLLEDIITHPQTRYLLLLGAYRDHEVSPSHPLMLTLGNIRKTDAVVHEMTLTPLTVKDLGQLITDALRCAPELAAQLASLVHEKTAGNPFFAIQFLTALHAERLLEFDHAASAWRWDVAKIHAKGFTDNVVDFMVRKLRRLPAVTGDVLKLAACVGNTTSLHTLALISDRSEQQIERDLWAAVREGMMLCANGVYTFLHDRVQQGAYTLIEDDRKKEVHLKIGRILLASLDAQRIEETVFDLVNQLNQGVDLVTDPAERREIARLNLIAGRKAKRSIAYVPARNFLAVATALQSEQTWASHYDFVFSIFMERAECEYLCGAFEQAEALFERLLAQTRTDIDKAMVYELRLKLYQVAGRYDGAVAMALKALRLFSMDIPDDDDSLREATRAEAAAARANWGNRRIADLAEAPEATDPSVRAVIGLLANAAPAAYIGSRPQLFPLVILKLVNYSLTFGHTKESCLGYSAYGFMLVSLFDDPRSAYEFSEMSIKLNEKLGDISRRGTVLHLHGHHVNPWLHHITTDFPILERGFLACLDAGDLVFASFIAFETVWQAFERGDTLDDVLELSKKYATFTRECRNEAVYRTILIQQQFFKSLKGQTRGLTTLDDESFEGAPCLERIAGATFTTGIVLWHVMHLIGAYLFGDIPKALRHADEARKMLSAVMAMPTEAMFYCFHALALAATHPQAKTEDERQEILATLANHEKKLCYWAENCPANFRAKHALVCAEIARITGDVLQAERLYEEAIRSARENGFIHCEGLSNELAAHFYRERQFETIATTYLREARHCYVRWGADGKVQQLDQQYTCLVERRPTALATVAVRCNQLDLLTVFKASQAISGQIVLDQLLDTLMRIVIENAGAQKGLLLLARGEELLLAAEASAASAASADGQPVRVCIHNEQGLSASNVPLSILNYVRRSRERVLLPDAAAPNPFSADEYLSRRRARSVLCLPILRQAELVGLLYLENNLVTHAFTPDRQVVLDLLMSQAAISLDNASLYSNLQQENRERQRAENALRESQQLLQSIIEEREALLASERAARSEAEAANRMKDEFLATLSHEMRTPLQAILGWSRILLRSGHIDPQNLRRGLETIKRNAHSQARLIEDLLDMSRIITGRLSLDIQPLDLSVVIEAAIESVQPAADAKQIPLERHLDLAAGRIRGDPNRMQQVVWNLLSNAVKFTPRGGRVRVSLQRGPSDVRISVSDTGAGIDPEFLPHVFEYFRQADTSTTRRHGGLGLGLGIVRHLVELHGGTVQAASDGVNRGASFTVSLPLAPEADPAMVEPPRPAPEAHDGARSGSESSLEGT